MISIGTRSFADSTQRDVIIDGMGFRLSHWLPKEGAATVPPMAMLVEQSPHSVLAPHFHRQNQFQLFVQGSGTIGAHALKPYQLHYAGAYTAYGPLRAGPEGLSYFTLRARLDTGAGFLPDARPALLNGPRHHDMSESFDGLMHSSDTVCQTILGSPDSDLFATTMALPPNVDVVRPKSALAQFVVVLKGAVMFEERLLNPLEHVFLEGCHLAFLRMPDLDETYAAAPPPDESFFFKAPSAPAA
jgi:hypothetical protein